MVLPQGDLLMVCWQVLDRIPWYCHMDNLLMLCLQVLGIIPWLCHTLNLLMLALQLHWFALMVRGALRVLRSGDVRQDIKEE